ncbi:MAG: hypothetical protein ACJA08_001075 [Cyclobacteriaceae bacterium]|jgi:hypothetical protein
MLYYLNEGLLRAIDLRTKGLNDISDDVMSFVFIEEEPLKGQFIIIGLDVNSNDSKRELKYIVGDSNGNVKKEFKGSDDLKPFVKQTIPNTFPILTKKFGVVNKRMMLLDSMDFTNQQLTKLSKAMSNTSLELASFKKRLSSIKEFQWGRTASDKEKQIRDQTALIEFQTEKLKDLELKQNLTKKKYFDFVKELTTTE